MSAEQEAWDINQIGISFLFMDLRRALVGTHGTKPHGHQTTDARALVGAHTTERCCKTTSNQRVRCHFEYTATPTTLLRASVLRTGSASKLRCPGQSEV